MRLASTNLMHIILLSVVCLHTVAQYDFNITYRELKWRKVIKAEIDSIDEN